MVDNQGRHDIEDIYEALHKVLDERNIDGNTHMEHHRFVELLIEERELKRQRWERFRLSAIGTLATMTVGALVWIGKLVLDYILHVDP